MLVQVVNTTHIEKVTLKYFTVGHTFMSADNFHRSVEKEMKQMEKVHDFNDFITCVSNVDEAFVLNPSNFYLFRSGLSHSKVSKKTRPKFADVQVLEFRKGLINMFFKHSLDADADFQRSKLLESKHQGNA